MKRRRIAIYPVFADTLPIVRYYQHYRADVEITELISSPGSAACGKDASFLDNREELGILVKPEDEINPNAWDEMILLYHDYVGFTQMEVQRMFYDPLISVATQNKKKTVFFNNLTRNNQQQAVRQRKNEHHGTLNPIKKYTVLVGGIVGSANSLEVYLNLYGELSKHLKVAAFSSSVHAEACDTESLHNVIYNTTISEADKILAINRLIIQKASAINADLVLVHIDEALVPLNNSYTNGFGIVPYMISHIISPDFSICCLPHEYANDGFITEFAQGLEERFRFMPDVWHISNVSLDHSAAEIIDANMLYAPIETIKPIVEEQQNAEHILGSLVENKFLLNCTDKILDDFRIYKTVEVLN